MEVLSIYRLNIYHVLTLIFKIKRDTSLAAFRNDFRKMYHRYPTGFSQINFVEGDILPNQTKFAVSSWDPKLWNSLLNQEQKIWHNLMLKVPDEKTFQPSAGSLPRTILFYFNIFIFLFFEYSRIVETE